MDLKYFQLLYVDSNNNIEIDANLIDKEGEVVDLASLVEELDEYMIGRLKEKSLVSYQLQPLLYKVLVYELMQISSSQVTIAALLSDPFYRHLLSSVMIISSLLTLRMQKEGYKVETTEEPLDSEEIKSLLRKTKASETVYQQLQLGVHPQDSIKELVKNGEITEDEARTLLGEENEFNGIDFDSLSQQEVSSDLSTEDTEGDSEEDE